MNQEKSFKDFLRDLSPSAFKVLGLDQLAYIKAETGDSRYELRGADGHILATFSTLERAMNATQEQDLKPVTVH